MQSVDWLECADECVLRIEWVLRGQPLQRFVNLTEHRAVSVPEIAPIRSAGYRYNESRAKSLLDVPSLLRNPHCVHVNLRHGHRGTGSIEGRHMYVLYAQDNQRKVAFVTRNAHSELNVPVASFWTNPGWVAHCADFRRCGCVTVIHVRAVRTEKATLFKVAFLAH